MAKLHGEDREALQEHCSRAGIPFEATKPNVPLEAFFGTRVLTAGSSAIVGTTDALDQVVAAFRNRSVVGAFGAQLLTGLVGNAPLPVLTAGATVTWHSSETAAATPTDQTFAPISLSPKKVSATTEISKMLARQSDGEAIVRNDLANAIISAVDTAAVAGSGASGQPTGVLNHGSINSVTGTSLAWSGVLDFIVNAGAQHADVTGFAMPAATYKLLANRARLASGSIPDHSRWRDRRPAG